MRKLFALLMLGSLLVASNGFALTDDGVNSLGVYFEDTYEANCVDVPEANTQVISYWVLANCERPSMGGFEFMWGYDPAPAVDPFVLSTTLPAGALNIGDPPFEFIVGLGVPLVTSEATVLVTQTSLWTVPPGDPLAVMAGPVENASIPGVPVFNDGEDPGMLLPMTFSTLTPDHMPDADGFLSVGSIGCPGPVATDNTSFSNLKALYR